jgi:hypothetical protein
MKRRITTLVASGFLALASPAMAVDLAKGLNKKQIEDRTGVKLQCSDLISLDRQFHSRSATTTRSCGRGHGGGGADPAAAP